MSMKVYYEKDCNQKALEGKKVAIIGYGSQGHAHSLNLTESGFDVRVGMYSMESGSAKQAQADGLKVMPVAEAVRESDVVMILAPDEVQRNLYYTDIEPNIKKGGYLVFAHGFNIHYGQIVPREDLNVFMVAPKSPGHLVRRTYTEGFGVPTLVAVYQDTSGDTLDVALAYAAGTGAARAGIIETSFKEETETDLFGEQAVLCGGVSDLMKAGFETLVEAGYAPEMAYFECVHEMKLIVDLVYEKGFEMMRSSISNTAEYGDYVTGPRLITEETKKEMRAVLKDIQDGTFAKNFLLDKQVNFPTLHATRRNWADHQIEVTGKQLRSMMKFSQK